MNNEELYNRIDAEDDMSDSEKREAYFSAEADREMFGDDIENYGLEDVGCK